VSRSEALGIEPDRRESRSSELLQQLLDLVNVEAVVGSVEVPVDLQQRMVVGGLGVGP
jgi:hypothetical protein